MESNKNRPDDLSDNIEWPTDEEEAAIQRGIDQDPDNPELTDEFFARAEPASLIMPPEFMAEREVSVRRRRGPQREPTKKPVSLRLDADVAERLRASGRGWQTRVNEMLRKALEKSAA